MKKKILAMSIAAGMSVFAGVASAAMEVNANGVGYINILPYYSAQGDNVSMFSVTNTSTTTYKLAKVRFRGAEFSDDVFDFQLFLSPQDVYTFYVARDAATGEAKFYTDDNSCTLPARATLNGAALSTQRLVGTADEKLAGTREGYVEIISMADVSDAAVQATIKHSGHNGMTLSNALSKPTCDAAILGSSTNAIDLTSKLVAPTGGLMSWGIVADLKNTKAFTFTATAISPTLTDVPVKPLYWRQADLQSDVYAGGAAVLTGGAVATYTADAALLLIQPYEFDLPDLSTPYNAATGTLTTPALQRNAVSGLFADKGTVVTEYVTDDGIAASTDVVLSQPTRRFYYTFVNSTPLSPAVTGASGIYANTDFTAARGGLTTVNTPAAYGREEQAFNVGTPGGIVISPNVGAPDSPFYVRGEVSVVTINQGQTTKSESLGAQLTNVDYLFSGFAPADGWVKLNVQNKKAADVILPVIGFTAINMFNQGGNNGTGSNYGMTLPLRKM